MLVLMTLMWWAGERLGAEVESGVTGNRSGGLGGRDGRGPFGRLRAGGTGWEDGGRAGLGLADGGGVIAGGDRGEDFLTEDRDIARRLDADLHHVAFNAG